MKIAHVVDSMDLGGAETLVAQMCRLQRAQGHDPSIYAVSTLGALGEQMLEEGFVVQPHLGRNLTDGIRNLLQIFKQSKPQVVHLHNPTPTIYGAIAARMAGVPSIVSTRHSLVAPPHKVVAELKYAFAALFCDWIVGICDATTENLKSIHSVPPRKIVRVYNGAAPLQRAAKEAWPLKTGFTLLFVGRLAQVKNHTLLLNAFHTAHLTMPSLRLWMVGDGTEREVLERMATELGIVEHVTFWGERLDVAHFFSAADVFIMSSKSEGLPMSLLQAFSIGLPSIVTDVGGMAEAVKLAKAGIIVPVTNPAEMASAILRLANSVAQREQLSINAEEAFQSKFTLRTMVDSYMELYKSTARARRAVKE